MHGKGACPPGPRRAPQRLREQCADVLWHVAWSANRQSREPRQADVLRLAPWIHQWQSPRDSSAKRRCSAPHQDRARPGAPRQWHQGFHPWPDQSHRCRSVPPSRMPCSALTRLCTTNNMHNVRSPHGARQTSPTCRTSMRKWFPPTSTSQPVPKGLLRQRLDLQSVATDRLDHHERAAQGTEVFRCHLGNGNP